VGVPYPLLWALWVALVDFLPMIGGALAGIPTVLFAAAHSLTAGIVTLVVFLVYTQVENHILNPVIMSRTVKINPLLVLLSILVAASIGSWIGGLFGGFVAALLAIPAAGAIQVIVAETWRATAPPPPPAPPPPEPQHPAIQQHITVDRQVSVQERVPGQDAPIQTQVAMHEEVTLQGDLPDQDVPSAQPKAPSS